MPNIWDKIAGAISGFFGSGDPLGNDDPLGGKGANDQSGKEKSDMLPYVLIGAAVFLLIVILIIFRK
jgi:hypothetical protein